jgi:hypothetical protein
MHVKEVDERFSNGGTTDTITNDRMLCVRRFVCARRYLDILAGGVTTFCTTDPVLAFAVCLHSRPFLEHQHDGKERRKEA